MFKNQRVAIKLLRECKGNILVVGEADAEKNTLINMVGFESSETVDGCAVMEKYPNDYLFTDKGFELLKLEVLESKVIILDEVSVNNADLFKVSRLYKFIKSSSERDQRIIMLTRTEVTPALAICFDGLITITTPDDRSFVFPIKDTLTFH